MAAVVHVSIILILLMLAGKSLLLILDSEESFTAETLVIGFQVLTIGVSLPIIFLPLSGEIPAVAFLLLTLSALMLIVKMKKGSVKSIFPSLRALTYILGGILVLWLLGIFYLRVHSSPDNHGFAATVSYLRDHSSLDYLERDFIDSTGALKPVHLGQQTSRLNSVWNIADARLRFTSDMILTVGRIGLPSVISAFIPFTRSAESIGQLILMVGGIGVLSVGNGLSRVFGEIRGLISGSPSSSGLGRFQFAGVAVIVMTSPLLTVMFLEGAATQIWSLAIGISTMATALRLRRTLNSKSFLLKVVELSIGPVFLALVYPHGLIICLFVLVMGAVIVLTKGIGTTRDFIIFVALYFCVLASVALVLLRTTRYSFVPLLRQFASGVSGMPYNLGFISLWDAMIWMGSSISFAKVSGPGSGFDGVPARVPSIAEFIFPIFISLVVLLFSVRKFSSRDKLVFLTLAFTSVVFCLPLFQLITKSETQQYIYVRNLALAGVFVVPLFAWAVLMFSDLLMRQFKSNIANKLKIGLFSIGLALQVLPFAQAVRHFQSVSTPFAHDISESLRSVIGRGNGVFLSERPEHSYFELTTYGKFNYLTDNWNPRLGSCFVDRSCVEVGSNFEFEVYWLYKTKNGKPELDVIRLGSLQVSSAIDGPLYLKDLLSLSGFAATSEFYLLLETHE